MATYNEIASGETDPNAPGTSSLFKRLVSNPIAMVQGETDAPYDHSQWHPYNGTTVGDGETGLIYDNAVDGNAQIIITPDFEPNYGYLFLGVDMDTSADLNIRMSFYKDDDLSYTTDELKVALNGTTRRQFLVQVYCPKMVAKAAWVKMQSRDNTGPPGAKDATNLPVIHDTAQSLGKARFVVTFGNVINNGKIFMYKRREFIGL